MAKTVQEMKDTVTKDWLVGDVVKQYPGAAEILMQYGLHCVGCGGAYFETLEQGVLGHGMDESALTSMLKDVNEYVAKEGPTTKATDGIQLTEKAADKIKELMKQQKSKAKGLRVGITAGGCSGFRYQMEFEEKRKEDDQTFNVHGIELFVQKDALEQLNGVKIDYVDGLQGAGFKISNPHAQKTCGCGESFH